MKNLTIASYGSYNHRRYSSPWVAICDAHCQPNFSSRVGSYTGSRDSGESGDLVIYEPQDRAVYMYGQKDYRNPKYTERSYGIYHSDRFWRHDKATCLRWLRGEDEQAAIIESDLADGD